MVFASSGKNKGMAERGSSKHGSRHDEAIKQRTEPIERGAPGESRVEERLTEEGWSDGEISNGRLSDRSFEARSDIARYLDRVVFPARRDQLLEDAVSNHAPTPVIERLEELPNATLFENVEQIWEALGGTPERRP